MNKIAVTITEIASKEKVSLVSFSVGHECLEMISLGVSEDLTVGSSVRVGVKASNIILSLTRVSDVSITNQVEVEIVMVTMGSLLCSVAFTFERVTWECVITQKSADMMGLSEGKRLFMLIKSSDLSIIEVL